MQKIMKHRGGHIKFETHLYTWSVSSIGRVPDNLVKGPGFKNKIQYWKEHNLVLNSSYHNSIDQILLKLQNLYKISSIYIGTSIV